MRLRYSLALDRTKLFLVIKGWTTAGDRPKPRRYLGALHVVDAAGLASLQEEPIRQRAQPGRTFIAGLARGSYRGAGAPLQNLATESRGL